MLPDFPHFEPFTLTHLPHIDRVTSTDAPYSDFNFTSLFCWNRNGGAQCAQLHNNLVLRFPDYLTGEPFYTFFGTNQPSETANRLLEVARAEGREPILRLIPEPIASQLDRTKFFVTEDPDNFDYVLSTDRLLTYAGSDLKTHRNAVTRFNRDYQAQTRLLDLNDPKTQELLDACFFEWVAQKSIPHTQAENEHAAFVNLFRLATHRPLIGIGVFVDDMLAGFTIVERLPGPWAMIHFEKALPKKWVGIYAYLMQETARVLSEQGCTHLNYQQDLGIPGLKTGKQRFAPVHKLKKYRVRWNENP